MLSKKLRIKESSEIGSEIDLEWFHLLSNPMSITNPHLEWQLQAQEDVKQWKWPNYENQVAGSRLVTSN